jgi:hypothetical protein
MGEDRAFCMPVIAESLRGGEDRAFCMPVIAEADVEDSSAPLSIE